MRWLLLFTCACYQPTPPAGAACGAGDTCPTGLDCQNGFCLVPGTAIDATNFDAPVIPPDACTTFASQLDTCSVSPGTPLILSGTYTYNTDTHELRQGNTTVATGIEIDGPVGKIDVLVTESLTFTTGKINLSGNVPFGIVSFGDLTLGGDLDASGGGAGARGSTACGSARGGNGTTNSEGSSAGGGGALRGTGGLGGAGDVNGVPVAGAAGGVAIALPAGLLGGCSGGAGGGGVNGGSGGAGGGAVYLAARGTITISGDIDVGGDGGDHGDAPSGAGGGGGSGGMIVIEGASVAVTGTLVANGGGGGGGADDIVPNDGLDGQDGRLDAIRAAGGDGAGSGEGGIGGTGGAGSGVDGAVSIGDADNGGGGGGGGCGFIAIGSPNVNTTGSVISPGLSPWPTP